MGNKASYKNEWQYNPMAAKTVKENVAGCYCPNKRGIEPKEHPHVVRRPEILRDPSDKTPVQQRFVKDVNDI